MIYKEFIIRSKDGEKLRADLRYVPNGREKPVIIFFHGFKGFKDWGPFPTIREHLASCGFISVAFNSSHNGVGDDMMTFTELDRFAENTVSREIDEAGDVISEVSELDNIPIDRAEVQAGVVGLHGHSRGASTVILAAQYHSGVRAVAAWAPPISFNRYTDPRRREWREKGYIEIENSRTSQTMRLNVSLLDDIEKNHDRLDVVAAARNLTSQHKALLLVSGSEDLTVPATDSRALFAASVKQFSELEIISSAGHTFGAEHPNRAIPGPMMKALDLTVNFFQNYLVIRPIPLPD